MGREQSKKRSRVEPATIDRPTATKRAAQVQETESADPRPGGGALPRSRATRAPPEGTLGRTADAVPLLGPDHDRPLLDADWYKDAVFYELHVRAFQDSNDDGIGDFIGLTRRLDYLKEIGVTTLWLLPFYPSPLRDDGYDIAAYTDVHPAYGTLDDFRRFLREAHRRDLRVVTELVINHTSDQHPWFQRARRAPPDSPERDFYVWGDTPDRYQDARIIFRDFEASNWSWDPVARSYYWHRFYSHQPDLNFDNPAVHDAIIRVLDFWLDMGVDGLRLDAVPYLYEREGTNCENLPETHEYLKKLRQHVDEKYGDRMLLAEANQWPEDSVEYFGQGRGDECHAAFHFPLMPRLFMSIRAEDRFPLLDIVAQTPDIPESAQWLVFLRNHDELTLEMVTDEERDYMYRVYAADPRARINLGIRRRLSPLLGNDRRRIELMNALLFSLPGTPVIYYGDELGMGDNIYLGDRDSVRTPMQWSPDRNAGFSRANPQKLYLPVISDPEYHSDAVNVETQIANRHSLLWWTRRLIALRRRYRAFGRGTIRFLHPDNPKVLAYFREHEDEKLLIVANLSRFAQSATLEMQDLEGYRPVELFGHVDFPPIRHDRPYVITLGPHGFYWFHLEAEQEGPVPRPDAREAPPLRVGQDWRELFDGSKRSRLEGELTARLPHKRWFRSKTRSIQSTTISDVIPLGAAVEDPVIVYLDVDYRDGEPETYVIPLAYVPPSEAAEILHDRPDDVVLRLESEIRAEDGMSGGIVVEGFARPEVSRMILESIVKEGAAAGPHGTLQATGSTILSAAVEAEGLPPPRPPRAEQSNTSVIYGERFILKLFRRLDEGVNPDLEMGRYLTEKANFSHTPRTLGSIGYHTGAGTSTLAILQEFVPNEGDAWRYTLDHLGRYYERALAKESEREPALETPPIPLLARAHATLPPEALDRIGPFLENARLLGRRTAEMHVALARDSDDPAFAPEAFTPFSQRALYQSMRTQNNQIMALLSKHSSRLGDHDRELAGAVRGAEERIHTVFRRVADQRPDGKRTRVHGDYHLGQVLYTGKDFVIIDFEGEPQRPPSERRIKRSPLRDVAGMLRSFDYAAQVALRDLIANGIVPADHESTLRQYGRFWSYWIGAAFLGAYLQTPGTGRFLPATAEGLSALLDAHILEKALYELGYELNNRPEWVRVPLEGILAIIRETTD